MALHESELSFLYIYCSGVSVHLCIMFHHSKTHVICNLQAMLLVHTQYNTSAWNTMSYQGNTNQHYARQSTAQPPLPGSKARPPCKHPLLQTQCRAVVSSVDLAFIFHPLPHAITLGSCQHLHTFPRGFDNAIELHMIVSDVQVC